MLKMVITAAVGAVLSGVLGCFLLPVLALLQKQYLKSKE